MPAYKLSLWPGLSYISGRDKARIDARFLVWISLNISNPIGRILTFVQYILNTKKKQGPTRHRPIAHRILNISDTLYCLLSTYRVYHLLSTVYSLLSTVSYFNWSFYYFTTLLLQLQTLQKLQTCLFLSILLDDYWVSYLPTGWPHDHGTTNIRAMVKKKHYWFKSYCNVKWFCK